MTIAVSHIFEFLENAGTLVLDRREVAMPAFNRLRRSVRRIYLELADIEDAESIEISDKLRMYMSEWLTVPIRFDTSMADSLFTIGDVRDVRLRWGDEIANSYEEALTIVQEISTQPNPLRVEVKNVIEQARREGRSFRIYCHRRARADFETMIDPNSTPLTDECFLHSLHDYRQARVFDTLVKVGPLRSYGWSSAPDALITAPRFHRLTQIVWSGCADETGFGYDPVAPLGANGMTGQGTQRETRYAITWESQLTTIGDTNLSGGVEQIEDEFQLFSASTPRADRRPAVLVQFDPEHGVLYPVHAQVLSFDPTASLPDAIAERRIGSELLVGMFCIMPRLEAVDFGGLRAGEGVFSSKWKQALRDALRNDAEALCNNLRAAGIRLLDLRSRLTSWARDPTTVIHAPQRRGDFEILINVLQVTFSQDDPRAANAIPWWKYAWRESQRSRGEAIQMGLQEQEIVNEELRALLTGSAEQIRAQAEIADQFQLPITAGTDTYGDSLFFRITSIEEGYLAPDADLKCVRELSTIEQWRV